MSDEPKDPNAGGDQPDEATPPGTPETGESGGLGLTDEFDRIEAEIEEEMDRAAASSEGVASASEAPPADDEASEGNDSLGMPPETSSSTGSGEEGLTEDEAAAGGETAGGEAEPELEPEAEAEAEPEPEPEESEQQTEISAAISEPSASEHPLITPMPRPTPIAVAATTPDEELEEKTPRLGLSFLVGSLLIILSMATATTAVGLISLEDLVNKLRNNKIVVDERDLDKVGGGDPQTLLLIGSDKRSSAPDAGARSDTTMLVRIDPSKELLSMFSLPRDLVVEIPGYGTGKLNEAFSVGNARLTLKTVKQLTGLEINHLAKIDFEGFGEAVNALGCVYIDVDRDYFNDNSGFDQYATIDLNPGYQRLCGQDALDYVRYRHFDTDIVRAARQQDFLREARAQVPVGEIAVSLGDHDLVNIMIEHIESDIDTGGELLGLLKSFIGVRNAAVNEVHFEGDIGDATNTDVTATDEQIQAAVDQFLGNQASEGPRGGENSSDQPAEPRQREKDKEKKNKPEQDSGDGDDGPTVIAADPKFALMANTVEREFGGDFSGFYPSVVDEFSAFDSTSRTYDICVEGPVEGDCKETEDAYKMVIRWSPNISLPEYYGVMGTTWDDPLILENPSEIREIDGREYLLFYDGDRLRLVGFRFEGNSYWVSNTLTQALDEPDMLEIATTMKQAHYKKK